MTSDVTRARSQRKLKSIPVVLFPCYCKKKITSMNKGLDRLRTGKFPNLGYYFIQPVESLAAGLANMDGQGDIGVKLGT